MTFWARLASFVASGTSIAFLIIAGGIILFANPIGAPFMILVKHYFPIFGFVCLACQIFPLCCPSYLRAPASHDNYTSWISLVGVILAVIIAAWTLPYNESRSFVAWYVVGFALLDALLLGVSAAVRKVVGAAAPAAHP